MPLASRLKSALKANLVAGVLVVTPLAATLFILDALASWVDRTLLLLPPAYRPDALLGFHVPGLGFVLLLVLLFVAGFLVRNFFGRALVRLGEAVVEKIPLVRTFYNAIKQLLEAVFAGTGREFERVVLVEYPRKGVYALAFVTGTASDGIQEKIGTPCLNLFLPTTPNPTSGFYLVVPEQECIPVDMGVEEAFKLLISGGIIRSETVKEQQR